MNALDAASTWIQIHPAVLYLDTKTAIDSAGLLRRELTLRYLTQNYAFDAAVLRAALRAAGLTDVQCPP